MYKLIINNVIIINIVFCEISAVYKPAEDSVMSVLLILEESLHLLILILIFTSLYNPCYPSWPFVKIKINGISDQISNDYQLNLLFFKYSSSYSKLLSIIISYSVFNNTKILSKCYWKKYIYNFIVSWCVKT